jgi:uncharacterized cupin superfamily protein/glyoxylase-like metal-dependent hydrolase (beta-lactamase superfamily II)
MQALAPAGFHAWSQWQPDRNLFFSSHLWVREGGNVAFDPLPLGNEDAGQIESLGGVATILLTNRDHARGAAALRERFGSRVLCSQREAGLFDLQIDGTIEDEPLQGVTSIALNGGKTPGEVAFLIASAGIAVVGDAIVGAPAGALSFMADEKLADPVALALSLRRLWSPEVTTLLLGDGASLFAGVDDALGTLLQSRGGPAANRINLDELVYQRFEDAAGKYVSFDAEVGYPIGARKLGYQAVRLPAGTLFCPMHAHDQEEELFFVVAGTPSVRTPRGTLALRPGDVMAFPTGDGGTHQLLNESDTEATVLLIGMEEPDEVVYYPSSQKVGLVRRKLLVRQDRLDYYDGE